MKKIYSSLYAILCASLFANVINAQTVLYTNNFDNPSSFTLGASSSNTWVINNVYQGGNLFSGTPIPTVPSQPASFTNPNQNYLHPSSPLAFGSNFQVITNANYVIGSGSAILRATMNTSIDATNYTNVTVSFWRVGGLNGMKVVYSLNGGQTWLDAGLSFQGSPTTWIQETVTIAALAGQPNVRIGFEMAEAQLADPAPNPYHSIDELTITATPGVPTPGGEIGINLSVPISGYCSGQSVSATYNVVTGNINAGNIYSLELSNANGNFDNAVVIGTSSSSLTTGTVNGVIPNGLTGSNFRMRITSSNEAIIGNDNGIGFSITASPATPVITFNSNTGQLQVTTNAPTFQWFLFGNPIPNSQNQTSITPSMNGEYTVVATNGNCESASQIFIVDFIGDQGEISINLSVPITGYCSGQSVSATYNVVTGNINVGNIYSLELSDATGNFGNAVVIGTSSSSLTTGTVNGVLPNDLTGSNFRMRVTASNEAIIGNDNGTDFSIAASPATPVITLNSNTGQLQVTTNAPSFQWFFFGDPIPNSQNQTSITPLMNGGYTVVATNGNCERSSEIFLVNFVGLATEELTTVRVFPNPFTSTINLEFDAEIKSAFSVLDLTGKVVFQSSEMLQSIHLDKLSSGMYFIQFHDLKGQTIRIIKE